jgi:hypothetical protein
MTQQTSHNMPPPATEVAKQQAADVGRTTADAGRHVADTAAEQAGQVAQEAKRQARDLLGEVRDQATQQARTGQQNAADSIRGLADELREMVDNGDRHGTASELAAQAADRLGGVADWIGAREPGDLVEEVRRFARRRPGAFLLGAAVAGILAGRLTRGAVDAQRDTGSDTDRFPAPDSMAPLPVVPSPAVRPVGPPPGYAPPPGLGPAPDGTLGAPPLPPYAPDGGTDRPGSVPPPQPPPLPSTPPPASPAYPPSPGPQQSPGRTSMTATEYAQERERGTGPAPGSAR